MHYSYLQKGNTHLAAILKYFLEVINLSVYIFGICIYFYVSGEEIVEKDARMSLLRLFEHIWWNITLGNIPFLAEKEIRF